MSGAVLPPRHVVLDRPAQPAAVIPIDGDDRPLPARHVAIVSVLLIAASIAVLLAS